MRSVSASIKISVPSVLALQAFLDIDLLQGWWGVERGFVQAVPGGVWAMAWERSEAGFKYSGTGIISVYEPGKHLRIEKMMYFNPDHPILGPMILAVTARPDGKGCELTVVQDGYGDGDHWDWYYNAVVEGWPASLKLLKTFLESRE
jgi:uncharacterized protein YndB with AHSA1/START domain